LIGAFTIRFGHQAFLTNQKVDNRIGFGSTFQILETVNMQL
jgi:hypothetical protein